MDELFDELEFELEGGLTDDADNKSDCKSNHEEIQACDQRDYYQFGPSLPQKDVGYKEVKYVHVENSDPVEVTFTVPDKPVHEHEVDMWDIINEFETDAWSSKTAGVKTGWDTFDKAFDGGIKPGFIVIGGDSNLGKSAVMSQLAWQIVVNNPNAYVMDFSLDDAMPDKLARIIGSGSRVLLNAVKNPNNYTEMPLMLVRRQHALNKLRNVVDCYRAYDANFTTYIEEIEEEIQRKLITMEQAGLDKQLVVFIDNLHDLNVKAFPSVTDTKAKYDLIAQWCADTAIRYNIPIICTAELRKVNGARRPDLDDIRELTLKICIN